MKEVIDRRAVVVVESRSDIPVTHETIVHETTPDSSWRTSVQQCRTSVVQIGWMSHVPRWSSHSWGFAASSTQAITHRSSKDITDESCDTTLRILAKHRRWYSGRCLKMFPLRSCSQDTNQENSFFVACSTNTMLSGSYRLRWAITRKTFLLTNRYTANKSAPDCKSPAEAIFGRQIWTQLDLLKPSHTEIHEWNELLWTAGRIVEHKANVTNPKYNTLRS